MQGYNYYRKLIFINIVVFAFQYLTRQQFLYIFGLVPAYFITKLWLWQAVTYMFMHGGLFHILFNMYALWMFGSDIEREWGSREFLKYYFLTGIGAGLLTYISSASSLVPTVGASGAVFGLLAAYGLMYPDRIVLVSFLFPMKAKHFVILYGLMEFVYCLSGTNDGIGHFAHLGGMLIGYVYLKYWPRMVLRTAPWGVLRTGLFYGIGRRLRDTKQKREKAREEVFSKRIDEILDKISRQGIESLNRGEKKMLNRYRGYKGPE